MWWLSHIVRILLPHLLVFNQVPYFSNKFFRGFFFAIAFPVAIATGSDKYTSTSTSTYHDGLPASL